MTDQELLMSFEACTLPFEQWTHEAHVRVAYLYASETTLEVATERIRTGIKAYNAATDTPEAIDRGYHETITVAFMRLVFDAVTGTGPHSSSTDFCSAHPELMRKDVLKEYYSRERIMTWEAKQSFVEPDEKPLPLPATQVDFTLVSSLNETQIVQLHELTQKQWWGGKRTLEQVRTMVENTSVIVALAESSTGSLVGFCRALTDFVFRATIYDVMVRPDLQGHGLGARLIDELLQQPGLSDVSFIYLACESELESFYQRWGFRNYESRAGWMIKVQREEV